MVACAVTVFVTVGAGAGVAVVVTVGPGLVTVGPGSVTVGPGVDTVWVTVGGASGRLAKDCVVDAPPGKAAPMISPAVPEAAAKARAAHGLRRGVPDPPERALVVGNA